MHTCSEHPTKVEHLRAKDYKEANYSPKTWEHNTSPLPSSRRSGKSRAIEAKDRDKKLREINGGWEVCILLFHNLKQPGNRDTTTSTLGRRPAQINP